jgi:hypothetical protein
MSNVKADIKHIFLEALERQGREGLLHFLDEACGGDPALLRERNMGSSL